MRTQDKGRDKRDRIDQSDGGEYEEEVYCRHSRSPLEEKERNKAFLDCFKEDFFLEEKSELSSGIFFLRKREIN